MPPTVYYRDPISFTLTFPPINLYSNASVKVVLVVSDYFGANTTSKSTQINIKTTNPAGNGTNFKFFDHNATYDAAVLANASSITSIFVHYPPISHPSHPSSLRTPTDSPAP
jgi:hypothetical protein